MLKLLSIIVCLFGSIKTDMLLTRVPEAFHYCQTLNSENGTMDFSDDNAKNFYKGPCDLTHHETYCAVKIGGVYDNETKHQLYGCAHCPERTGDHKDEICFLMRSRGNPTKPTIDCCCKTPDCSAIIFRDAYFGWFQNDTDDHCGQAHFDSIASPSWTYPPPATVSDHSTTCYELKERFDVCYMRISFSDFEDGRSKRLKKRLKMDLGCGCPFDFDYDRKMQVLVADRHLIYCCVGEKCNKDMYRMFGFEYVQNFVALDEENELLARIRVEYESHHERKFADNVDYVYPKFLYDKLRVRIIAIVGMACLLGVIYVRIERIEKRRPKKATISLNLTKHNEFSKDL